MAKKSLWPDKFDAQVKEGPKGILEEQAAELEEKTGGRLTARIDVGTIGESISLDFVIVAPTLNAYEYRLFQVLHRVHPPFSAKFVVAGETPVAVKNRREFETQLAHVLQSAMTTALVSELLGLVSKTNKGKHGKKS